MADSTAKAVLSTIATSNSKLPSIPIKDGQLIFVQDKNMIAFDFGSRRRVYKQIEDLATEADRLSLLAPVTDCYYYVVETSVLWAYRNGWVQITTTPESIQASSDAALKDAKAYADKIGERATGSIDDEGNLVIMFGEQMWTNE